MAKKGQVEIQVKLDSADAQKKATGFFGDLKNKAKEAGQSFSEMGALGKAAIGGAIVAGAAMAVNALINVGKAIVEIGREASKFQSVQNAFGAMARGIGQDADVMLQKMREGIKGTVNDLTLMTEANKAMMLGLDMGRVDEMMGIALAASKATGQSVEQTTAAILGGLAEQKANMLESVGITFDANAAYAEYAKSLGKTADQLTNAEKKQAFLNEALKVGNKIVGEQGGLLTFDQSMSKIGATIDNFKSKLAATALPALTALGNMAAKAADNISKMFGSGAQDTSTSIFDKLGKAVAYVGGFISGYIGSWIKMFKLLGDTIQSVAKVMEASFNMTAAAAQGNIEQAKQYYNELKVAAEKSIETQGQLAIQFAKAGLPAAIANAHESMSEYEQTLARVNTEQEKAGQSARSLGSALDNVRPDGKHAQAAAPEKPKGIGMDVGAEVSGKIDAMSGIAGLGGGVTGVVGMAVEGAIQSYTTMLNAEAQFLAVRSQKVSYFADLFIGLAQKQKEMEIQTAQEKWDAIIEKEKEGFAALQTQIEDNMTAHIEQINAGYAQQLFSTEEKETKIVQAQKFAQEQKDKNTKEYNKKMAQTEKDKNAEMKRLADEKEAQDSAMRKQRAMITWMIQAAQLEAQKRIQIAQVTISTASSAAQALGMSIGMLGPIAGTVVGAGLAANIIAAGEMSKAAIMSQVALPPSDLFLADGGIVMPRPGGVQATIAEAGQPEAVIPLDRMGSMGGVTINVQNLYATEDLPERLVDMIDQELYKRARVGQSVFASEVAR